MTHPTYVQAHLALLLAQYGERAVVEALAPLLGKSPSELESLLADVRKVGHVRPARSSLKREPGLSIDALLAEHPDKADAIRKLQSRFVNRTLLPELKDVRRFLDRHGQSSSSLKKRDDAFVRVARQLVQLPLSELEAMLTMPTDGPISSLGVISDQILGRK